MANVLKFPYVRKPYIIMITGADVRDIFSGKNSEEDIIYNVEPSDGGGIEGTFSTLTEAEEYIHNNCGYLEYIT